MAVAKILLLLVMLALVVACAAPGPLYTEISAAIPSVPPNKGRIYFFRRDSGSTVDIHLNGMIVGKSAPGTFFYVDQDPGRYAVMMSGESGNSLTFVLERGRTRYVQISAYAGGITPQLVSVAAAGTKMVDLHYTGAPLTAE